MSASQRKPVVYEKVAERLYRLASTGGFYARVWVRGKEIRRSLETKDWQLAKRRLRDLRKDLERLDNEATHTTIKAHLETFLASSQNKSESTRQKFEMIAKRIHDEWPGGSGQNVTDHFKMRHQ